MLRYYRNHFKAEGNDTLDILDWLGEKVDDNIRNYKHDKTEDGATKYLASFCCGLGPAYQNWE